MLADAGQAADLVQRLRERDQLDLVPFGPRTHVPALELAARLVADHDVPAVVEAVEGPLRREVADARRARDTAALVRLATEAVALRPAREAALAAARLLFEEGRWWECAALAARAGGAPGAAELAAVAGARVASAAAADGDRPAAGAGGGSPVPSTAGGDGAAPAVAAAGEGPTARGAEEPPGDALSGTPAGGSPGTALRGAASGAADGEDPGSVASWSWRYAFARDRGPGQGLPLVADGLGDELLVADGLGLLAVRRSLAPSGDEVPSWRRVELPGGRHAWVEERVRHAWTLSASPGRLPLLPHDPRRMSSARSGTRIVVPCNRVSVDRSYSEDHYARRAHLIAFDLDARRQAWDVAAPEPPPGAPTSSAFGPPVVAGDRVFVQLFRVGLTTEVSLLGYALGNGALLFETPLVRGAHVERYASRQSETSEWRIDKRASEGEVAVRDGVVHACTGYGVVAAVDGLTGRIRHTFRYDRLHAVDFDRYDPSLLFDTGGWDHEPVRLHGDRVVVAPSDSRYLYVLAAEPGPRGHLILDDPIERLGNRHVVALLPDPEGRPSPAVLVSRVRNGRFGLVLLGPDGHVLAASPELGAGEHVVHEGLVARPVLAGRAVLVPTATGLRAYDLDDLDAAPVLLERPVGLSAPLSLHAVRGGVAAVSLEPRDERMMWVECWSARP